MKFLKSPLVMMLVFWTVLAGCDSTGMSEAEETVPVTLSLSVSNGDLASSAVPGVVAGEFAFADATGGAFFAAKSNHVEITRARLLVRTIKLHARDHDDDGDDSGDDRDDSGDDGDDSGDDRDDSGDDGDDSGDDGDDSGDDRDDSGDDRDDSGDDGDDSGDDRDDSGDDGDDSGDDRDDSGDDRDDSSNDADDDSDDDSEEFRTEMMVIELDPNSIFATEIDIAYIPLGTYHKMSFYIHKPDDDGVLPEGAEDFMEGESGNERFSIIIDGLYNGEEFTYKSRTGYRQMMNLDPDLEVDGTATGPLNISLHVDLSTWFVGRFGEDLDPTATDNRTRNAIEKSIRDSFRLFSNGNGNGNAGGNGNGNRPG